jgi:hypothetical protein
MPGASTSRRTRVRDPPPGQRTSLNQPKKNILTAPAFLIRTFRPSAQRLLAVASMPRKNSILSTMSECERIRSGGALRPGEPRKADGGARPCSFFFRLLNRLTDGPARISGRIWKVNWDARCRVSIDDRRREGKKPVDGIYAFREY